MSPPALPPLPDVAAAAKPPPTGRMPVHMQPRPGRLGRIGNLHQRVGRTGIYLARLCADDGRPATLAQRAAKRTHLHPPLVISSDNRRRAEPEKPKGAIDCHMPLRASEHANWRCTLQTGLTDIPPHGVQDMETGSRKSSHM